MEVVGDFEYNTKDLIGHGAFAVVFKGRHRKKTNLTVAIKSITKKNLAKSQNLLGKEIKILKELTALHHENVVELLDCKETPHNVYLVMEYCNGGDLADYLSVKGTLSEDTIRLFLRQLAGAMKALHAKGIVHRDLKPQNILLSHNVVGTGGKAACPQPTEMKLKIADFGFARFLQDGVMAATLCGSPMYMAPEVIMSLQYDAKADLWSLGTIVFQCLTGKAPFQAQTPQALKQFYEKNANLAPKIPAGTSAELAHLLLHLLRRNARDRMEFDDFFSHPFLQWPTSGYRGAGVANLPPNPSSHHASSAVPNPTPQPRSNPTFVPPTTCQTQARPPSSNQHSRIPSARTGGNPSAAVPVSLKGNAPVGIGLAHAHGGANVPSSQPVAGAEPPEEQQLLLCEASTPPSSSPMSAAGHESASSHEDDFVLVPANIPSDNSCDSNSSEKHRSGEYGEPVIVRGQPRGKASAFQQHGSKNNQQCPLLASPPRPSFLPVSPATGQAEVRPHHTSRQMTQPSAESPPASPSRSPKPVVPNSSEPIPVPTHRETYHLLHGSCAREGGTHHAAALSNNPGSLKENENNNDEATVRHRSPSSSPRSPTKNAVPRSQPISMKRTHDSHRNIADISSLSPPAVQFMIGTPPGGGVSGNGGRRRSASGSSCGTPPPVTTWQVSPVAQCASGLGVGGMPAAGAGATARQTPNNSPLRRSATAGGVCCSGGTLPPILGSPSASRLPTSPTSAFMDFAMADNAAALGGSRSDRDRCGNFPTAPDLRQPPFVPFGTRAMTLPEITDVPACLQRRPSLGLFHETFGDSLPFGSSPSALEGPLMFVAPELPEETLLEREHNETLAKLNFVLALVDCIVELAKSRANPLTALTESLSRKSSNSSSTGNGSSPSSEGASASLNLSVPMSEGARKAEQLVLLVRALQLLSSGLNLATQQLRAGQLQPSATVKNVVGQLNERFHYCLSTCKQLNSTGLLQRAGVDPSTTNITADKILYNHAIEMCQSAALDELFGNPQECFQRYQTAQILLHSLSQHVHHEQDKALLTKYKDAVEKRLYVLQQQGYIYAYDTT
ncbi:serine/threonine-protein kinase ULK2 isoform X2 [Ischnura elegans]|uniref:serine/threonine-protein kinase ULK2 isoform X2 n=1 Tax=Ischnura elegans TaxID=197161 RepID=UPI001ED87AF6|nr:serine/threonine-protein kinase ULK2 isoform X2 [Ischnura elegans]